MPLLSCYVDDQTLHILEGFARQSGRTVIDLAESAIAEGANNAARSQPELYPDKDRADG